MENNRIEIPLNNGFKLVACQNTDPIYNQELYVGIEDENGVFYQDIVCVQSSYEYDRNGKVHYNDHGIFNVYVWQNELSEDYSHKLEVKLYKE